MSVGEASAYEGWLTVISSEAFGFFCRVYFVSLLTFLEAWSETTSGGDGMDTAAPLTQKLRFSCVNARH